MGMYSLGGKGLKEGGGHLSTEVQKIQSHWRGEANWRMAYMKWRRGNQTSPGAGSRYGNWVGNGVT